MTDYKPVFDRVYLTCSARPLVSTGSSSAQAAATRQAPPSRLTAVVWWWVRTSMTEMKGDTSAPSREKALVAPMPSDRTLVGYTCRVWEGRQRTVRCMRVLLKTLYI